MSGRFCGRVALITGAASGIGRALAEELGRRRAHVVAAARDEAGARRVATGIARTGGSARARALDVTCAEMFAEVVRETAEELGAIDYFFNNAGIAVGGEARDLPLEDWRRTLDVNVHGVVHGVHAVYPLMIEQGSGHIVNTASIAGLFGFPLAVPYTASKHAVVGLSLGLRAEGADLGVRVSAVCPGAIDTAIWDSEWRGFDREQLEKRVPRRLSPDRCARAILRGVVKNRPIIVIGRDAKWIAAVNRAAPWLGRRLAGRLVRQARAARAVANAPAPRAVAPTAAR